MPKKPRKKKVKQPKPTRDRTYPRPEKGKPDFIRPDPASVPKSDNYDCKSGGLIGIRARRSSKLALQHNIYEGPDATRGFSIFTL